MCRRVIVISLCVCLCVSVPTFSLQGKSYLVNSVNVGLRNTRIYRENICVAIYTQLSQQVATLLELLLLKLLSPLDKHDYKEKDVILNLRGFFPLYIAFTYMYNIRFCECTNTLHNYIDVYYI